MTEECRRRVLRFGRRSQGIEVGLPTHIPARCCLEALGPPWFGGNTEKNWFDRQGHAIDSWAAYSSKYTQENRRVVRAQA